MEYLIEDSWITPEGYQAVVTLVSPTVPHRCGYIAVPQEHPLYNKNYDDLYDISVHGGLTYSEYDKQTNYPMLLAEKVKWFGFDAAHAGDGYDWKAGEALIKTNKDRYRVKSVRKIVDKGEENDTIRTLEYMKEQCNELSKQLRPRDDKKDS